MKWIIPLFLLVSVASYSQTFGTIATFSSFGGPNCLIQGSDGNFYGANTSVFELTPSGEITTIVGNLKAIASSLLQASDGTLYGVSQESIFKILPGGVVSVLDTSQLIGLPNPGAVLNSIIQGSDGNFYGTATQGGSSANSSTFGFGTVFKMTPDGALTVLHNFSGPDGERPQAGLIQGADGNFYGTTEYGGANTTGTCFIKNADAEGCGTVFKITPSGSLTTLHSFNGNDGKSPSVLIQANDGNLYGIAEGGGQYGEVYRLTPSGLLNTLYAFGPTADDGANPQFLLQATDRNLYGATLKGGNPACPNLSGYGPGCGTIFQLTLAGTLTTLFDFPPGYDLPPGQDTVSAAVTALFQATDGNLYGSVELPGGAVFKLTLAPPTTVYGAALAPGYAGLYQVAIQIPATLANGDYPVVATINGAQSPSTTMITVQQ